MQYLSSSFILVIFQYFNMIFCYGSQISDIYYSIHLGKQNIFRQNHEHSEHLSLNVTNDSWSWIIDLFQKLRKHRTILNMRVIKVWPSCCVSIHLYKMFYVPYIFMTSLFGVHYFHFSYHHVRFVFVKEYFYNNEILQK